MKLQTFIAALLLLITTGLHAQSSVVAVEENGARSRRINLVFLSEGYTSSQMGTFATDVQTAINYLFTREPWVRYRSYCNVYRIQIPSNQSGTDNGNTGGAGVARDTYFGTGFNIPGIPQNNTISTTGSTRAYSLLNTHVPEYDIPVVLVNDSKYGGSGGPLAVVTTNSSSPQILEHELGHSFAKLTDEYDEEYPGYPNVEYPNATTKTVRSQIRWNVWIEASTTLPTSEGNFVFGGPFNQLIGLYEGANYHRAGWYRPHDNKLMRSLNQEPGSITREALILAYYGRVGMIEAATPTATTLTHTTQVPLTFGLTLKAPSTSPALTIEWRLDNVLQAATSSTFNVQSRDIGNGTHTLKAIVRDPTPWVRRDPSALMVEEKTWTLKLSNQTDPPVINTPLPATRVLALLNTLQLDATATGPGPITYQWLKNNVPLKPAVTTPTLTVGPVTLASAGTYSVRITNPAYTLTHSCKLAVVDTFNLVSKVVVGQGRTATLTFGASTNLPPASWFLGASTLTNGTHYANATTRALQIKSVTTADTGSYTFASGDYGPSPTIQLQVVTNKPDYTGQTLSLPTGMIAAGYSESFPLPTDPLLTPNSFSAVGLPKGLIISAKTGRITGIPTVASINQTLGDEVTFTVGNEFGKVVLKIRMLIRPLPPGVAGSFSGLVYLNSVLGTTTGGMMNINVTSTGYYTGSAVVGSETLSFSGTVSTSLFSPTIAQGSISLKPKHLSSPLTMFFATNDYSDADPATAGLTDSSNFNLWRNKWVPPEAADPLAGYHTFYLTPSTNADAPKGYGFGSVTIDTNGKTITTGKLPDGSAFATTSVLIPDGNIFVYQTLYATPSKGSFLAYLYLDPGPPPVFISAGSASRWFRPADTRAATIARAYAAGFGPESPLPVGGLYVPPAKTAIPMELPAATGVPLRNAQLTFQQIVGDDPLAVNADVTLNLKPGGSATINTPNPKAVTFKLNPADGRFTGTYTTKDADPRPPVPPAIARPAITRTVSYQGIIVRSSGVQSGFGYFLRYALPKADGTTTTTTSPQHSGTVNLVPAP